MITIVVGKPGAGKSYDTTDRLANDLVGRLRQSAELPTICTNLRLNQEEFDEYLRKYSKKQDHHVDIQYLDDSILSQPCWWLNLPANSRVILDEAQFYLSNARISKEEQQNLIETLSTHRHRRQDWILLTQSLTSLSVDVRRYCENVIEVLNAKSISLPWPLSISLRDVQVLLWGFGVRSQIYRTREGLLEGTYKVAWEGELIVKRTSKEIYALYRSTERKEQGDSALPFADGKGAWLRALRWFFLRHGLRFILLGSVVVFLFLCVYAKFFYKRAGDPFKPVSSKISIPQDKHVYNTPDFDDINLGADSAPIISKEWSIRDGKTYNTSHDLRVDDRVNPGRVRLVTQADD